MYDGTLGNCTSIEYKIELLEGVQLHHAKPFPIPKINQETLKTGISRLVSIGVLKCKNKSEWAVTIFIIPKTNGTVCFISDFRELKKRIIFHSQNIEFTFKARRLEIHLIFRVKYGLLS